MKKIGIIREGKIPQDNRVALSPSQCVLIQKRFPLQIKVESSPHRCIKDEEYIKVNIPVVENVRDCDILLGIKEVPISQLIDEKTYFFFSHTIKQQSYNRKLLQSILKKHIRLIDYETLRDANGNRVIAFGKFAGMVGAHNALWAYGKKSKKYSIDRMHSFHNYQEAKKVYRQLSFPPFKIVLTGTGRVSQGAAQVLKDAGIKRVAASAFLKQNFDYPVFTQLGPKQYVRKKDGSPFIHLLDFFQNPSLFESRFAPFTQVADVMINGIYWDPKSPAFFSAEDMLDSAFSIQLISDVTCDIAPDSSIPSTLRSSTIADPIYGYDPNTHAEVNAFSKHSIDVIAVDNLPNELPRDASMAFGRQFIKEVLPEMFKKTSRMLSEATIAENGKLTQPYKYLENFVAG